MTDTGVRSIREYGLQWPTDLHSCASLGSNSDRTIHCYLGSKLIYLLIFRQKEENKRALYIYRSFVKIERML